ncbi:MAG: ferritin family protein [Nitrospirota bacterium]
MEGGIRAWEGLRAEGIPEAGMIYFDTAKNPEELIALAWTLEEGSRRFYAEISAQIEDIDTLTLFKNLTTAEEHHKTALINLYTSLTGKAPDAGFPHSLVSAGTANNHMEGGMQVSEAVAWARAKNVHEILELSIALETNAYDLYLKMRSAAGNDRSKKVFTTLYEEEKEHLDRLAELLGKKF